jgi:hypothetical protein
MDPAFPNLCLVSTLQGASFGGGRARQALNRRPFALESPQEVQFHVLVELTTPCRRSRRCETGLCMYAVMAAVCMYVCELWLADARMDVQAAQGLPGTAV